LNASGGIFDPESSREELSRLQAKLENPEVWKNPEEAKNLTQQVSRLKEHIEEWASFNRRLSDVKELFRLVVEEESWEELPSILQEVQELVKDLRRREVEFLLSGPYDERNALFSIHAGAGGTEAQDWVDMLLRMYLKWMEKRGYKVEVLSRTPGEEAGTKLITLYVKGKYAYGLLKAEKGVHRLVRISPFDANKRRHTSFALVEVLPEIPEEKIQINPEDIKMDAFRASGPGGQYVNKTSSAVRLTHIPTGIVVECQTERSQYQNRQMALKLLGAKLYEIQEQKRREEEKNLKGEKVDMGWGYQIRSYVLHPYRMIKDLRTRVETGDTDRVLDGDLDEFIWAFLMQEKRNNKNEAPA